MGFNEWLHIYALGRGIPWTGIKKDNEAARIRVLLCLALIELPIGLVVVGVRGTLGGFLYVSLGIISKSKVTSSIGMVNFLAKF